jgi:hypothetical protein
MPNIAESYAKATRFRRGQARYKVTQRCSCCGKPVWVYTDISDVEQLWTITPRCCDKCQSANTLYTEIVGEGISAWVWLRHMRCQCGKGRRPTPSEARQMKA